MRLPKYLHAQGGDLWLTEQERDNVNIQYRIKSVLFEAQSPFQHILVLDSYQFGRMLVLDGVVQTTAIDGYIYNEMIAHVPLSFHPNPERVLIIGGGDCGAAREVCKHRAVREVDLVEIDELVVRACLEHLPEVSGRLNDPRVRFVFADGVEFIRSVDRPYDVVVVDSSDPVGPAAQLFEEEFYRNVFRALKPDGLMVCQSQSPIFHAEVMLRTYERIGRLFADTRLYTAVVPTYPGGLWSFTLGSKKPLPPAETLRFRLPARYVNEDILRSCFRLPEFVRNMLEMKEKVPENA
ncbi:MAG: spermidine synthase [Candidatus Reconcilbacillus cellulovorans]|uniref:Polyamine aminopropyltransferase n=1 Tax=Candidatus Reconcilbacillus cellulovorans TaxID=1906605 RepID=A0A2A6DYG5_9BACL|nr:MAG: spermidine synthase [Candidatus Reconcilbacillus cellulovorans]